MHENCKLGFFILKMKSDSFVILNYLFTVPGRNACEIKMFHQEDAGLNVEMAKLAFAKGIWSYVCKMDSALRKHSGISHPQLSSAVTLIQKVGTVSIHILLIACILWLLFKVFVEVKALGLLGYSEAIFVFIC